MSEKTIWRMEYGNGFIVAGMMVLLLAMGGCAGETPKPQPTMTPEQVRGNTDKAFERLKQEEKQRALDSGRDPY